MSAPGSIADSIARTVCMALYSINAVSNVVCVVILGVILTKGVGDSSSPPFNTALAIAIHGWCMVANTAIQSVYWRRQLPPKHSLGGILMTLLLGCCGTLVGAPCFLGFSPTKRFQSLELPSCRGVTNGVQQLLTKSRRSVKRAYRAAELRRFLVSFRLPTLLHLFAEGLPLAIFQSMLLQTVLTAPVENPNGILLALKFVLFTSIISASLHLLFCFPHLCFSGDRLLDALRCCALIHDVLSAICMIRIFRSPDFAPWGTHVSQLWTGAPFSGSFALPRIWATLQLACFFCSLLVAVLWVVFHNGWSFRTKTLRCGLCVIAAGPVVLLTWTLKFCLLMVPEVIYDEPMPAHWQEGKVVMFEFLAEKYWKHRFQSLANFVGDTIRPQLASSSSSGGKDDFLQDIAHDWSALMVQEKLLAEGPPRNEDRRLSLAWVYFIAIFQAFTFLFPYLVWMTGGQAPSSSGSSSSGSSVMGKAEKGLLLTSAVALLPILALLPRQYRHLKFVVRCLPLYTVMMRLDKLHRMSTSVSIRCRSGQGEGKRRMGTSNCSPPSMSSPSVLIAALDSYYMWQPPVDLAQTRLRECLMNELLPFDVSQRIVSFAALNRIEFERTEDEEVGELKPLNLESRLSLLIEEEYRRMGEGLAFSTKRYQQEVGEARYLLSDF
jgi:hypothetical protein